MVDLVLFPSSYFSTSKVDEDLQAEYDAVKATGLFNIISKKSPSSARRG